jgi:biopolymer transport protein ExbB
MKKTGTFILFLVLSSITFAQSIDQNAIDVSQAGATKVAEEITAWEFIMKGGLFLIPIGILLFYSIYLGVEKFVSISRSAKYNRQLMSDVEKKILAGDIKEAITRLEQDKSSYAVILKEGVETIGRPMSEIESKMEKAANIEIGKMEKNLGHLGLIAGIAPTLGFIGTISGVIKIFYSISVSENVSIGNISGGLYEKMISSGAGLIAGIVAYTFYHLINGKIDNFLLKVQQATLNFTNILQKPNHGN